MSDHELNRCVSALEEQVYWLNVRQALLALGLAVAAVILLIMNV